MKRQRHYYYAIPKDELDDLGVPSVLDMLRYDGSTVESNAPKGYYLFKHQDHGPNLERWASFTVRDVIQGRERHEIELEIERRRNLAGLE